MSSCIRRPGVKRWENGSQNGKLFEQSANQVLQSLENLIFNGLGERAVQRNAHDSLNDSGKPQFRPVSHCKELGALLRVKPDIEEEASWLQMRSMRAGGGGPGQSMYVTHHTATRPVTPLLHSITMFSTRLSATL